VLAHPPLRDREHHRWRIYAGADAVTATASVSVPGLPATLERRGDFVEVDVSSETSFVLDADGPVLPVLYLQSRRWTGEDPASGTLAGDPSMVHAVPSDRFARRYVVTTPAEFPIDFVQVIQRSNAATIRLDGVAVDGWQDVGEYRVANVALADGTHALASDDAFGALQFGWSSGEDDQCPLSQNEVKCFSSYAHAVGLAWRR
jgi:hypothetical protein